MKVFKSNKGLIKAWTDGVMFDDNSLNQLKNIADLPFIYKWVSAMPDVHLGKGATVGSVIPTKQAIIPAAVGVDIGCGMMAVQTTLTANDLPDSLADIRSQIERAVPHGFVSVQNRSVKGGWAITPNSVATRYRNKLEEGYKKLIDKHPKIAVKSPVSQLGSLGGGNHFIEICLDEHQNVWVMLHSGSRGAGNAIGRYFIEKAKREMEKHFIHLVDKDLAYFPEGSDLFDDYCDAVHWAQKYAYENREQMMAIVLNVLRENLRPFQINRSAINCHHNYVEKENHYGENVWVTRKGAVRARVGDLGIIPGSMGAKSFIVKGLGNQESFCSCSHGAGRVMSRTKAKEVINLEDHIKDTQGIECRKDVDVIDESPRAYKNIDDVMNAQKDLVEIVATLRQVVCVKG